MERISRARSRSTRPAMKRKSPGVRARSRRAAQLPSSRFLGFGGRELVIRWCGSVARGCSPRFPSESVCEWYGRTLVRIDTFFPSSKACCICRTINAALRLEDRWHCPNCRTEHQRDENAVVNILVEGLRILAEGRSVCGGTVRPNRKIRRAPVEQETSLETCGNAA